MYVSPKYLSLIPRTFLWSVLLLTLSTCQPWQDPTTDLENRSIAHLDSLLLTEVQLTTISDLATREQVDSLLVWTVLLKNYAEETALIYAQEATELATKSNLREDQGMGRYYMALLEGRQQVFQEGLADPFVNARISREIWYDKANPFWQASIDHLFGDLFYRQEVYDSAEYYLRLAQENLQDSTLTRSPDMVSLQGSIVHTLGMVAYEQDSLSEAEDLFEQAGAYYARSEDLEAQMILLQDKAYLQLAEENIDSALALVEQSFVLSEAESDRYGIALSAEIKGDFLVEEFHNKGDPTYLQTALEQYRTALSSNNKNKYYNYHNIAKVMQMKAFSIPDSFLLVDSAAFYYKLALQDSREEGALDYLKFISSNILRLCDWLTSSGRGDCAKTFGSSTADLMFANYAGVVDTITQDLAKANESFASFQRQEQELKNQYRLRTIGFLSLAGLLAAALIFVIVYQQQKQKRLEARMAALRAQINPHFFSNSLNAIESLVNLDQKKAASKYLIHFSRLTRRVLNSSLESSTSLASELETTKHFLMLEQLRFKDKLHFEIKVDPEIDPLSVEVPSLIFQPYLENAIWHGIKPKEVPSLLVLKIKKIGNKLTCVIEDDGIGREAAARLQEQTILNKKSVGMKITQERLQRFGGGRVEVDDLYQEDGQAAGTRVTLYLPFKNYER